MRSTLPRRSAEPRWLPRAGFLARPRLALGPPRAGPKAHIRWTFSLPLATLALVGCAPLGTLQEEAFRAAAPVRIDVRLSENGTVLPLREVGFGGLATRLITGPRVYDVPLLLRRSLRETLEEKGYEVSEGASASCCPGRDWRRGPAAPGETTSLPFDAVLLSRIESWGVRRGFPARVSMSLRLELRAAADGALLYEATVPGRFGDEREESAGKFLVGGLRGVARRGLGNLPARD